MQHTTLSEERASGPRAAAWRPRLPGGDATAGYLFILPSIVGFLVFVLYPLLSAGYYALTRWDGIGAPQWIGLENFRYMFFSDPVFWPSLRATALYVGLSVPLSLALGLLLALLLNARLPAVHVFRTIFYLPTVLPIVATLTLWKFIFNPQFGLANAALQAVGLPTSLWLGSERMAVPAMVLISLWGVGGTMVIFLGALQSVPAELYEAAAIDGANRSRMMLSITVPMITPIIFLQLVTQSIAALQAFAQPKILTQGGPNNATNFLMHKIYQNGFGALGKYPELGYATAQVWVLFLIIIAFTALTFRSASLWVYAENDD